MGGETAALFESLRPLVDGDVVAAVGAVYQFDVIDDVQNPPRLVMHNIHSLAEIATQFHTEVGAFREKMFHPHDRPPSLVCPVLSSTLQSAQCALRGYAARSWPDLVNTSSRSLMVSNDFY